MISSKISHTNEDKDGKNTSCPIREFSYESLRRSFYLPQTVEADKINAKYQDGLLRLEIPEKEESKRNPSKTIKIS